jgi:uncharacterized protein YtpQ (UPF0354 family)
MFSQFFQRKLTPQRFAALFLKQMQALPGIEGLRYVEADFAICYRQSGNSSEQRTFLRNAYTDALKQPGQHQAVITGYLKSLPMQAAMDEPRSFAQALPHLMPMLRDQAFLGLTHLQMQLMDGESSAIPSRQIAGAVHIALVEDTEHSVSSVNNKALQAWGVDFEEALAAATANLRERTTDQFAQIAPGLFQSTWSDVYDATRLLLPDMLHRLPILGHPVVAVPSRNHLLVAGSKDAAALSRLVDITVEVLDEDTRPLSATLLAHVDGAWSVADEAWQNHPKMRQVRLRMQHDDYAQQLPLLEKWLEQQGSDDFVAAHALIRPKDAQDWLSFSQWTGGVHGLLPVAEYLLLLLPETKETIFVPWPRALEIAGALMQQHTFWPLRYRVDAFPDEAQLAALRQHHVKLLDTAA